MKKNRALILTGIFPPDIGGPASYVPKVVKVLITNNFVVTVGTYSSKIHDPLDAQLGHTLVRINRGLPFWLREIKAFFCFFLLAVKTDVIYANGQFFKSSLIGLLLRKPVIAKIVGDEAWERATNQGRYSDTLDAYQLASKNLRLRYYDWLRTIPLFFAKSIIVPSAYLQKIVTGWGVPNSKVRVVYNGFEVSHSQNQANNDLPTTPMKNKKIITICRLVPWKGVKQLIEVLPQIPDSDLEIVGDGPEKLLLLELANKMGISDRVKFMGNLDHAVTLQCLAAADVFVLNSTYEGLPHVVLEAMGNRVPVVATLAGGTGEVVVDNQSGWAICVGDKTELVKKINFVLDDNNKHKVVVIVDNAFNMIKTKFSESQQWDKTMRIIEECI